MGLSGCKALQEQEGPGYFNGKFSSQVGQENWHGLAAVLHLWGPAASTPVQRQWPCLLGAFLARVVSPSPQMCVPVPPGLHALPDRWNDDLSMS